MRVRSEFSKVGVVLAVVALAVGLLALPASTEPRAAKPLLSQATGHYYEAVTVEGGITWEDARVAAEGRTFKGVSGHLATIGSAAEYRFLIRKFPQAFPVRDFYPPACQSSTVNPNQCNFPYWLGGFQGLAAAEPGGGWKWVTGEPFAYKNWAAGEPNQFEGLDEDCLTPHPDVGSPAWADMTCDRRIGGYFVEYPTCAGRRPTIVGTANADLITGTPGDDVVISFGGDDIIVTRGGDDLVCAGLGKDLVSGGPGDDDLRGEDGADTLAGTSGADNVFGGPGNDRLRGGTGADQLDGGPGNDRLWGWKHGDTLLGGGGADELRGEGGNDHLDGGPSTDLCRGGPGADTRTNCET